MFWQLLVALSWHKGCGCKGRTQTGFTPELLQCVLEIFRDIGGNLNFVQVLFIIEPVSSSTMDSCLCEKVLLNLLAGSESWFVPSPAVLGEFPGGISNLRRVEHSFLQ